jgi:hypothetical protein
MTYGSGPSAPSSPLLEILSHFYANRMDEASVLAQRLGSDLTASAVHLDNQIGTATKLSMAQFGGLPDWSVDTTLLRNLVAICRRPTLPRLLLEMVKERGALELPSPFSAGVAVSTESYELQEGINCLLFRDEEKCFVLIQEISSADAILFPEGNFIIGLTSAVSSRISRDLAERILTNLPKVISYAKSSASLGGLICSHHRPAHFYYEIYPALFSLLETGLLRSTRPTLIAREYQDFISVGALFDCPERVISSSQIFAEALEKQNFFITMGVNRGARENYHMLFRADRYLINRIARKPTFRTCIQRINAMDCYPLVWVGLVAQNRRWTEQIEGLAKILNELHAKFPKLGVVIDGWTSPLTRSKECEREVARDLELARALMLKIETGIQTLVLIGSTGEEKLAVASRINFFIANYTTGSIYVSRFAGKPGLCHCSDKLMEISLHIGAQYHPNRRVLLVAGPEIAPEKPRRAFRMRDLVRPRRMLRYARSLWETPPVHPPGSLNYSIDPTRMSEALANALPNLLADNAGELPAFFIEFPSCLDATLRLLLKVLSRGHLVSLKGDLPASLRLLKEIPPARLRKSLVVGALNFGLHSKVLARAKYMTWFVDPRQRFVSELSTLSKGLGLEAVATLALARRKRFDNPYVRRLSGLGARIERCDKTAFQMALRNLERLQFVGVDVKRTSSILKLAELFEFDAAILSGLLSPISPPQGQVLAAPEILPQEEWVNFDCELYAAATSLV